MANQNHYDIIIIGGGPGGYVAAIRAAQLGFKSADDFFDVVGKDEFSLRSIEAVLRPATTPAAAISRAARARGAAATSTCRPSIP